MSEGIADPSGRDRYVRSRRGHWDGVARDSVRRSGAGAYHRRIAQVYRHIVPRGAKVLELGCGGGDLLAALEPADGLGIDLSPGMIERARTRHPGLRFVEADAETFDPGETFDVVLLSDLINELWDAQSVLDRVRSYCRPHTRLLINAESRVWQGPLRLARRFGFARPLLQQNWFAPSDVENLLELTGFEAIRRWNEVLWPFATPLLGAVANRYAARMWPLRHLTLANFFLARPRATAPLAAAPRVSVVVPARNESGNIDAVLRRTPEMEGGTELIFVEGHSRDDTWEEIGRRITEHPERRCVALRQSGKGKGDAVRLGFAHATGEIVMILDADLTVPPEDLPRFAAALVSGKGEFVNGVRLVYPMEKEAMRFFNLVANKTFGLAFSWVLGQRVKDTLCGTKALWRADYERIAAERAYFGDFDPFGDFDLLFGAARLNLRIVDVPVRYRERTYGATNIRRWKEGWWLARMLVFAARRLKFA